jgi:hypothetical protein
MQSNDQPSETTSLQLQLKSVTEKFDRAIENNVQLGVLRELYHEMKEPTNKLEAQKKQSSNASYKPLQ